MTLLSGDTFRDTLASRLPPACCNLRDVLPLHIVSAASDELDSAIILKAEVLPALAGLHNEKACSDSIRPAEYLSYAVRESWVLLKGVNLFALWLQH